MLGDELVDVAPAVSAVSAADELAMLLAALEENPEGALADPFIRRVAALSTADQAKVHAKAKALKVPRGPTTQRSRR
jgi:hypothetical protein